MSNADPGDGGDDTVIVRTTAGAAVDTVEHYKSTDSDHNGAAGSNGVANVTFSIGRPTKGYTVAVSVSTSSGETCSTQFTPQ